MIRVAVVAASAITRAGLEAVLAAAPGITVGELSGADVVVAEVERQDEALPDGMRVVLLVDDPDPQWLREVLRAGAQAVIARQASREELVRAVEAAAAGLVVLDASAAEALAGTAAATPARAAGEIESLTPREIEVLRLLAEGDGNKAIAWKLGISEHTVKFHVASIMGKLNAASRTEAVATGIRRGLVML